MDTNDMMVNTDNGGNVRVQSLFSCNILLVGFMGTGKSTISSYLVKALGVEEIDPIHRVTG